MIGKIILWILLGLVALVLLIFIFGWIMNSINRYKQGRIFSETFSNRDFALPEIEYGYRYGWPTFKITFDSLLAYQNAEQLGLLIKFEKDISVICGSKFDPTLAITYLYSDKNSD